MFEEATPQQHRRQNVFGDGLFVMKGVRYQHARRQSVECDFVRARARGVHEAQFLRGTGHFGREPATDEDVRIAEVVEAARTGDIVPVHHRTWWQRRLEAIPVRHQIRIAHHNLHGQIRCISLWTFVARTVGVRFSEAMMASDY